MFFTGHITSCFSSQGCMDYFKFTFDIDIGFLAVKSILLFQKDKAILVISI